ncbi:MAG: alcohol dehydrogenase catalytic domain-containing protein [Anaerolineae bacterium]|nr:alcohol dehydrogenase catalytic domain-containing protein [Anaerolineae bacterium]
MTKMNAAMFYAPKDVRFERIDVPSPGPGELLVKIGAAVTCGTDIKTYERGHPAIIKKVPSTFGHEFSGQVVGVGKGVENFAEGDRVTCCNAVPCGECFYCKIGHRNLCEDLLVLNGAYAEYIVIPARMVKVNTYKLADHMTYQEAAVSEPLGTAIHCIKHAGIRQGDTVVVLGSGPLGLMICRLAHLQGARVILSGEITEERKRVATNFGVNEFINILEVKDVKERIQMVKDLTTAGKGADVAIEAAGFPEAWEEAIQMIRKAGTVVFHGGCKAGTSITLDTHAMHYFEHKLIGVFHQDPEDYRRSVQMLTARLVDGRQFVTETMPLNQLISAFERVRRFEGIKFAIDPSVM